MKKTSKDLSTVQARFRILHGNQIALGPGKARLLAKIAATGSIAEAAKELGMSYMRAWTLIKTMEACFKFPLLKISRGGKGHGGAVLTPAGTKILTLYQDLEAKSLKATIPFQKALLQQLRK